MSHEHEPLHHMMSPRVATLGVGSWRCGGSSHVAGSARVGPGVVIWHFAVVLGDVTIEPNVSIGSTAEIGRGSTIGRDSRISRGVFLPSNSRIGRGVFIGPNVTFTDDRYPRVLEPGEVYDAKPPIVEDGASIGAGAVILPGVRIGAGAMVAAGAVVVNDVPPAAQVRGIPAREIVGGVVPSALGVLSSRASGDAPPLVQ